MEPVMWLDPGVTTGWAAWRGEAFSSGQGNFAEVASVLEEHCAAEEALVGWERFQVTPMTYRLRGSETALEVIGMARYVVLRTGSAALSPGPRDARKAFPAPVLRALGWHSPGRGHANDAASHLAAWMTRSGIVPAEMRAILRARTLEGWNDDP